MSKVSRDLLRVTPAKIEEACKRAELIAEYSTLPHPTAALAQAYAKRLQISKAQFYVLLRMYREHGSIFANKSEAPTSGRVGIAPKLDRLIKSSIKAMGPDAPLSLITRRVNERADDLKLPRASENAVKSRVLLARRQNRGSKAFPPLVIDRSALNVNIRTPSGPEALWLTAVMHAPTGEIFGHHLSIGDAGAVEAARALEIAIMGEGDPGLPGDTIDNAVMLFQDLRPGWDDLTALLEDAGFMVVGPKSRRVRNGRAFHRLLGGIAKFAFRPFTEAGRPTSDGGDGIDFDIAAALVEEALAPYQPAGGDRASDDRLLDLSAGLRSLIESDHAR